MTWGCRRDEGKGLERGGKGRQLTYQKVSVLGACCTVQSALV